MYRSTYTEILVAEVGFLTDDDLLYGRTSRHNQSTTTNSAGSLSEFLAEFDNNWKASTSTRIPEPDLDYQEHLSMSTAQPTTTESVVPPETTLGFDVLQSHIGLMDDASDMFDEAMYDSENLLVDPGGWEWLEEMDWLNDLSGLTGR